MKVEDALDTCQVGTQEDVGQHFRCKICTFNADECIRGNRGSDED